MEVEHAFGCDAGRLTNIWIFFKWEKRNELVIWTVMQDNVLSTRDFLKLLFINFCSIA